VNARLSEIADAIQVIVCIAFDRRAAPAEVSAFKETVTRCPSVVRAIELSGTFDFLVEATIPDMEAYTSQLRICADVVARLIDRYETNFICKQLVRAKDKGAIWAPCDGGMVRIDCAKIDKVTAEGDYMRVHSARQSWMVHSTMGALVDCIEAETFVRLHRSILVRRDFIERLIHADSHWTAKLNDGSCERVAKVHTAALLESVRSASSTRRATSTKIGAPIEQPFVLNEN
jgi:DNA-binding LytR/AlgR family response regulator